MKTKSLAIALAATLSAACGSLSPTAPDDAVGVVDTGVSAGAVQAAGFGNRPGPRGPAPVPTADPGPVCAATALSLELDGSVSQVYVTPVFLGGDGKPASWQGCPSIEWSVSPEGGVLVPAPSPRDGGGPQTMMLVMLGADRVYTISAIAGTMKASVEVGSASDPGPRGPAPVPTADPGPVCAAASLSLELGGSVSQVYVTPSFLGGDGKPVSWQGCPSVKWSVSPEGAVLVPAPTSRDDGGPETMMLVMLGADRVYTVSAIAGAMTASVEVGH